MKAADGAESHVTVVVDNRVTCSCGYGYTYASESNARLGATLHRLGADLAKADVSARARR